LGRLTVGDIAKGVLSGAWTLIVGWILPTALNTALFCFAVAPSLDWAGLIALWPDTRNGLALLLLSASLLFGLVLSALHTPLYRILEGYLFWPGRAYEHGCERHRRARHLLQSWRTVLRLERRAADGTLSDEDQAQLDALHADPRIAAAAVRDRRRSAVQRAVLNERLARYPVDAEQIAPTRLGNAIRRFEEYGYNRYRLDTQVLWNELTGTVPSAVARHVELARAQVDFFVALLYGHLVVAVAALLPLLSDGADVPVLLATIAGTALLIPVWYRAAVVATDEWAATVRALVNLGRRPLADSLGLVLPGELESERTMWALVTKLSRLPYDERAAALDRYRADPSAQGCPCAPAGGRTPAPPGPPPR
jgi:hypothetical protein